MLHLRIRILGMFVLLLSGMMPIRSAIAESAIAPSVGQFEKAVPRKVGHHRIMFHDKVDDQAIDMMTVFSVSNAMAIGDAKVPMVVFLCGVGERGRDGDGVFLNGPPGEMERNPILRKTLPMVVMSPQCPDDHRWDDAVMARAVVDAVRVASKIPWIDTSRIYITGLSMGGKGTWLVVEAAPELFAAVSPISAIAVDPARAAAALKGMPTWIIVGAQDEGYLEGSQQMAAEMKKSGDDVLLTVLPDVGHYAWSKAYPRIEFYRWLLSAERGQPADKNRPSGEQLAIALNAPPTYFNRRMDREFHQFAQYWTLLNCGNYAQPGIREEINGKKKVMVTHPLTPEIPCMMQTTWTIPAGKPAKLSLVVGCHPQGKWKLIVRADGKELLNQVVSSETVKDGWLETTVDLSNFAGHEVPLEVLNSAVDWENSEAYWSKMAVEF